MVANQRKIYVLVLISMVFPSLMTGITQSISQNNSKLDLVFLLHANQANVPYGDVANDLCYHAVLETMLEHPSLHFPLHISGTLLTDLAWFNTTTIDLIKQGVESGQFELLGSTYSQNVMYSHDDDYDNVIQIKKHQQVIKSMFGVQPTGFWNPERCWDQERYVTLLGDAGYEYTFVEDHILNDSIPFSSPYEEYKVRNTSYNGNNILIINDDKEIINRIDNVAFTTQPADSADVKTAVDDLLGYLSIVYQNDLNDDFLVFYGQDMEAWGLWQEEGGFVSDTLENTVARLDYLFTRFEEESDWLNVVTPAENLEGFPPEYEFDFLPYIVPGTAVWMHQPSLNEGYTDWFDFSENDSRLIDYRNQFDIARERMKEIDTNIGAVSIGTQVRENAEHLMSYAKFVYAANQYEFGCIGCYFPWYYRTKSALITAEAANYALNPSHETEVLVQDLDHDGSNEYILRNAKAMFVFTGLGGRLINWYDIEHGEVLLANDIPNTYATWTVNGLGYDSGTYLASPIDIVTGSDLWGRTDKFYSLRPKAFYDRFDDSEAEWVWLSRNRTTILGESFVQFYLTYSNRAISKVFKLLPDRNTLQITYNYQNEESSEIFPEIGFSWSPGNEDLLMHGKSILYQDTSSNATHTTVSTVNTLEGIQIQLVAPNSGVPGPHTDAIDPMFGISQAPLVSGILPKVSFSLVMELSSRILSSPIITTTTESRTSSSITSIHIGPILSLLFLLGVSRSSIFVRRICKDRKNYENNF